MEGRVSYSGFLRVAIGKVVDGKIEVPGESFAEGLSVTVVVPEEEETFTLSASDKAQLLEAIDQGDRGEVTSAEDVFRELEDDL